MVTCMNLTLNILMSLLIGLGVYSYFLLKYKTVRAIIGKGDILFILFLTPFFEPRTFFLFMLVSLTATLLMWIIAVLIGEKYSNIPLVSGMGVCLFALFIYQQFI